MTGNNGKAAIRALGYEGIGAHSPTHDPERTAGERHVLTHGSVTDEAAPRGYDAVQRLGYEGAVEHSLTGGPDQATWAGKGCTRPGPEHEAEAEAG